MAMKSLGAAWSTASKEAIDNEELNAAQSSWEKLVKFESMHKTMEEGDGTDESPKGFFKLAGVFWFVLLLDPSLYLTPSVDW